MATTATSGLQLARSSRRTACSSCRSRAFRRPAQGRRGAGARRRPPINPSDLGLLFAAADMTTAKASGTATPGRHRDAPRPALRAMAARVDQSLPVGNEGAGVVVAAGSSPAAQALLGKTVGVDRRRDVLAVPPRATPRSAWCCRTGTTPAEGASCFVNPLTALGMVETMRREGHTALVHTAAASNLGQMLNKLCIEDGVAAGQHRAQAGAGGAAARARREVRLRLAARRRSWTI